MSEQPRRAGRRGLLLAALAALVLTGGATACYLVYHSRPDGHPVAPPEDEPVADLDTQVHQMCSACHAFPPPDSFPRSAWQHEVEQGYRFFSEGGLPLRVPPMDQAVRYFEERAPEQLPPIHFDAAATPAPVRFARTSFPVPPNLFPIAISNVNLVHLYDEKRLDILACDMFWGEVMVLRPYEKSPEWKVLYRTWAEKRFNPAHAEVVDLDGDGIKDILVANLGNYKPTDSAFGSVLWLRGRPDGSFTPIPLLEDVGRVADVQAADFRGTGKKDLVVAVFGLHKRGEILFLENQTTDWDHPKFVPHVLDKRPGGIHVPVADLNGDGRPDFVALISQEHETVVAFLNEGGGRFRKETLYKAPHPAWGSSGIQLVDVDGDGKLDVLYTNGDVLDQPYLLKPYHSVQWLENRTTDWSHPQFVHHPVTPMYGVHRAVATDFTGTGRKDVIAISYLPPDKFPERETRRLDSVIYLAQTAPGKFERHSLEAVTCDHVTCAAGDIYGTGRVDLVTATYTPAQGTTDGVTIWRNLGPPAGRK